MVRIDDIVTMTSLYRTEWPLKGPLLLLRWSQSLTAESVQRASLTLERVDDVHGGDGLTLGVFGVRDGITDDVLEENLEHSACLLVDEARDTLDTTTTGKTADGRLRDALDVVTQNFAMTLRATLSQTLASFTASRHDSDVFSSLIDQKMKPESMKDSLAEKWPSANSVNNPCASANSVNNLSHCAYLSLCLAVRVRACRC